MADLKKNQTDLEQLTGYINNRYYWADVLAELRAALIRAEANTAARFGTAPGIWIEQVITSGQRTEATPMDASAFNPAPAPAAAPGQMTEEMRRFRARYGLEPGGASAAAAAPQPAAAPDGTLAGGASTNVVGSA